MVPIQKNSQCLLRAPSLGVPVQSMSEVPDWQCLNVYPIDFIGRRLRGNCGKLIVENSNEISREILITGYWRELYEEASYVAAAPTRPGQVAWPRLEKARRAIAPSFTNRNFYRNSSESRAGSPEGNSARDCKSLGAYPHDVAAGRALLSHGSRPLGRNRRC